jgi:histidine triad (HIT) family protein
MSSHDCTFCKIVDKEIPSKVVYEDDSNLAFLSIRPISEGHTIVIPKNHYKTMEELPQEEIKNLFLIVKKVAKIIHERLSPDGYNILQNNFEAAGQEIPHSHVHIIPRTYGDQKIGLRIPPKEATEQVLENVLKKLEQ